MTTVRQLSFSHGEIAPGLYARPDLVSYATGLRTCRNWTIRPFGTLRNRAGTAFTGEVYDSTEAAVILPFIFNNSQTYELIFNKQTLQFVKNGSKIYEGSKNITVITQAAVGVVTSNAHGYTNGDEVYISGVVGMTQVNGRQFIVSNKTANTFELKDMGRSNVNTTGYTAYSSGGIVKRAYTISTPYAAVDLSTLKLAQSADTVFLVHGNYFARELLRTSDTSWALNILYYYADTGRSLWVSATRGAAGANTYVYQITAVGVDGEESEPILFTGTVITAISKAGTAVVTSNAHGYATGDIVFINSVSGMQEVNGREYTVGATTANTFELAGVDSTNFTTYVSGGQTYRTRATIAAAAVPTGAAPNALVWANTPLISTGSTVKVGTNPIVAWNIYRQTLDGNFGWIGTTPTAATAFNDTGYTPDISLAPPLWRDPFDRANYWPSVCMLSQQRLFLAAPNVAPEACYMSQTGHYRNFMVSFPSTAADAVSSVLIGKHVNQIVGLAELRKPLAFTTEQEWVFNGDTNGAITPNAPGVEAHSWNGSSTLPPLNVDADILYNQSRGSSIRNLTFDLQVDGYKGADLTTLSKHLFDGHTLSSWAYQRIPDSIVYACRDDGTALALTILKDEQIKGWTRLDFSNGFAEWVSSVPESTEDAVYWIIRRTVNGRTVRYIERSSSRLITNIVDANFLDSALLLDGRNTTATTMTLTGGTDWVYTENLILTASAAFFAATDVGNAIFLYGTDGSLVVCKIISFTSTTVVHVHPDRTVPVAMRSVALGMWSKAVKTMTGLWHLEGQSLSVLGDGLVQASVNNGGGLTVSSGAITFPQFAAVIRAGLPITADLLTNDTDVVQSETLMDKRMLINKVTVYMEDSRGIWAGNKAPTSDAVDPLQNLEEIKVRDAEGYDSPIALQTGPMDVHIPSEWLPGGRVFLRNVDPLPQGVLSIAPAGLFPIKGA